MNHILDPFSNSKLKRKKRLQKRPCETRLVTEESPQAGSPDSTHRSKSKSSIGRESPGLSHGKNDSEFVKLGDKSKASLLGSTKTLKNRLGGNPVPSSNISPKQSNRPSGKYLTVINPHQGPAPLDVQPLPGSKFPNSNIEESGSAVPGRGNVLMRYPGVTNIDDTLEELDQGVVHRIQIPVDARNLRDL